MLEQILAYVRNLLNGKFTYTIGWVSIIWAVVGMILGTLDVGTGSQIILTGCSAIGLRRAVKNVGNGTVVPN